MKSRPLIAVAALGGTISMAPAERGVVPTLTAAELLDGVELDVDVRAATLSTIPGTSLTFAGLTSCYEWAAAQEADGIVVVQGTDTLEETAYFFECIWPGERPVVLTGAMRHPSLLSPDGPANLANALTVAAAPSSRGRGALLAFNDDIHQARWARKAHSSHLEAFSSAPAGPVGMVAEGAVHYFHPAGPRLPALPAPRSDLLIPLLESGLDDSGAVLDAVVEAGAAGVVLAASGVGHVSDRMADAIERALTRIPVVVASRTGAGTTFRGTYGYRGAEADLIGMGVTMAGWLDPRKARVLLYLTLAAGLSVPAEFRLRGASGS
ncbi:L-asparaginase [Amycolatopsis xylanica]|uniref:L-asparaginase n=1 Tax=Amycolatopsis xylanica TaxID=589385 RepID=A0A1H3CLM5_9PSEU|nr:asparaginase [Amycolatopsis xylanica]SDX55005.1 L-asparaginase [Amycolatopsis xylanica]